MTALSSDERKALFVVHKGVFGPSLSHALNGYVAFYNRRTVEATEDTLNEFGRCNAGVQHLMIGLVGGGVLLGRGWLREVLQKLADELSSREHELVFVGCRNQVAAHWIREIMQSAL